MVRKGMGPFAPGHTGPWEPGVFVMSMLLLAVFPLAMIFGALWDLTTMTIPNVLTVALAAMFAVLVPFNQDQIDVVFLPQLQVHDGSAVKAVRCLNTSQAVSGRKVDFFTYLRRDKLIGPSLG